MLKFGSVFLLGEGNLCIWGSERSFSVAQIQILLRNIWVYPVGGRVAPPSSHTTGHAVPYHGGSSQPAGLANRLGK
jgi:hypothetical protein